MWRKLRFREANLIVCFDGIVSELNQGSSNPSQVKIKNKKGIFYLFAQAFHGMTLPLGMTGVKDLTRIISSSLTLFMPALGSVCFCVDLFWEESSLYMG